MRPFIIAPILMASAIAQSTTDYLACANAAITSITKSTLTSCTSKSSQECICANKSALKDISTSSAPACLGLDISTLISTLCPDETKSTETKATETKATETRAAFRHAGRPMQPVKRADGAKLTIYVTETRSDCGCTSTAVGGHVHGSATPVAGSMHISQIPVHVPTGSMGGVAAASSTPVRDHGLMGGTASSSVEQVGATPSGRPSGVDAKSFSPYTGAAVGVSVNGVVVLGVAAVMGVMVAL
ncbi:hypothetical protein N7517_009998 [Penicillium concentricum]|uniref:Extracellular membrane protein CFEM domain-containing protein n=1 Tax=Penicillium concentricum TaxID=293559 RepID=A0A9W9UXA4_9EURO|nr:uncharacterized protein N7517_009998 [Penicillium concentricum]KAJ5360807.1 hypothetical protein N7517_009998 [Penicillium concentricum]